MLINKQLRLRYNQCGILERWHNLTWDDFTNDEPVKKRILRYLDKVVSAKKDGVGYYLWGANGVGKSMLMALAFKDLIQKGYSVRIITLSSLITTFTTSWYDVEKRDYLYQELLTANFLGIEEIGKEFKSATDLGSVVLDSIIKYRVQRKFPVWATSNVSPNSFTDYYTEDIQSMLKECALPVQVTGEDVRNVNRNKLSKKY